MIEVIIAYILDLILGDPQGYPHPVRIIGEFVSFLEEKLRRIYKGTEGEKKAGIILCATVVLLTYGVVYALLFVISILGKYVVMAVSIFLIYTALATRSLDVEVRKVYKSLKDGDIDAARKHLSMIVSRETDRLDEKDIARAAIETVAENINDGIVAPIMYAVIGGAPLVLAYKAASTLDSMVGYKNEKYINFGWASAKLDDILNFIPARITGMLIPVAAWLLGYDGKNSFRIMLRDRLKHDSPNSAHGEAAVAGALGIKLGGTNYYFGRPENKPILGEGKRDIKAEHIIDAIKIMYITSLISLFFFLLVRFFIMM